MSVGELAGDELLDREVALVGDHGQAHAGRAQVGQEIGDAGVGAGVVLAVRGVVGAEVLVDGVPLGVVCAGGDGALHELADAVAHEAADVVERVGGHVVRREDGVDGEMQVAEAVEQRSVEVEDRGLVCGHGRSFRWPALG